MIGKYLAVIVWVKSLYVRISFIARAGRLRRFTMFSYDLFVCNTPDEKWVIGYEA